MTDFNIRDKTLVDSTQAFKSVIGFGQCKIIAGFMGCPALVTDDNGRKLKFSVVFTVKTLNFSWSDVQADWMNCIYAQLPATYRVKYSPLFSTYEQITIPLEDVKITHHLIVSVSPATLLYPDNYRLYDLPCILNRGNPSVPVTFEHPKLVQFLKDFTKELEQVDFSNINLLESPNVAVLINSRDYIRIGVKFPIDELCVLDTPNFKPQMQKAWADMLVISSHLREFCVNHDVTMKTAAILSQHLEDARPNILKESAQFTFNFQVDFNVLALTSAIRVTNLSTFSQQSGRPNRDHSMWGPTGYQMDREREKREEERKKQEAERREQQRIAEIKRKNERCACGEIPPRSFKN